MKMINLGEVTSDEVRLWPQLTCLAVENFFRINDHNFIGWRATMEDSHIEYIDENNDIYVFGVFDGHGGFTIIFCFCLNYIQEKRLHFLCKNILFQNY